MKAILDQFKDNIQRIRNLHSIYTHLSVSTTNIIDMSDILRAELAFAVSAFDYYIHGIVRIGMLEVFGKKRLETLSFKKFDISLERVKDAISNPGSLDWLEYEIIEQHGWKSFQLSGNVSDAIHLISDVNILGEIAKRFGINAEDLKGRWNLIVKRRNQIVHEADMDPSSENRWPINDAMVNDAIDFIENLADTIYDILK